MSDEFEVLSDGDGVAVFGDPSAVERFLAASGVPSREFTLRPALRSALGSGADVMQTSAQIAENSGRWVKLTEESARAMKLGKLMKGSSDQVSRAIVTTGKSRTAKILEFIRPESLGTVLTNPAMLAGAAGIMAQFAMQQTMDEITEYLAVIDEKVDDVLRAQKDAAIAEMIGVGLVIDDAVLKREHVGRVGEVTWSNLHGAAQTIATTQSYALRQLDALSEKAENSRRVGDLASVSRNIAGDVQDWLAVLARCFQLQDGLAVLELDRVLDSSPSDLDRHREAIQAGRRRRRDLIAATTRRLLTRMEAASAFANERVLFHPATAGVVVTASNEIGKDVATFHEQLSIPADREDLEARRWREAVGDVTDDVIHTATTGASAAARMGAGALSHVRSLSSNLTAGIAERFSRRSSEDPADPQDD